MVLTKAFFNWTSSSYPVSSARKRDTLASTMRNSSRLSGLEGISEIWSDTFIFQLRKMKRPEMLSDLPKMTELTENSTRLSPYYFLPGCSWPKTDPTLIRQMSVNPDSQESESTRFWWCNDPNYILLHGTAQECQTRKLGVHETLKLQWINAMDSSPSISFYSSFPFIIQGLRDFSLTQVILWTENKISDM